MINFRDLPDDTKFCIGNDEYFHVVDKSDIEDMLTNSKESRNPLPKIYVADKEDQQVDVSVIENIFEDVEENDGYEDQSIDLIHSLTDKEKNIIIDILNKAITANPAYHRGEKVLFEEEEK